MSSSSQGGSTQNRAQLAGWRKIISLILSLPRKAKVAVVVFTDCNIFAITVFMAFYLRLGELRVDIGPMVKATAISIALALPFFIIFGLYRAIFRHSGTHALLNVVRAVASYALAYAIFISIIGIEGVPRTIGIIQPLLLFFAIGASRAFARLIFGDVINVIRRQNTLPQMLVYGAGNSGQQLTAAIAASNDMHLIGFLDDDTRLHGHLINGVKVFDPADIVSIAKRHKVTDVCLAMPGISHSSRKRIIDNLSAASVVVRTIPNLSYIASGVVDLSTLASLDINDLLGREPVAPNQILMAKNIIGRTVLVTGAGGSIGSELCREIVAQEPKALVLIDNNEFALYQIHQELIGKKSNVEIQIVPILASVADERRIEKILSVWRPETVYHAAAYKHVPLVEDNPTEGIRNNVFGTLHMASAAIKSGVSDFVLISTDKAVRPTNVMGASKRVAELVLQAMAKHENKIKFALVRFGNVLGSSGSVVPLFNQQIKAGGPLTVTHSEVTRFFMTTAEAAQLVIQAAAMNRGADLFVLDMGNPVRIIDLARKMISLSGRSICDEDNPDGDIKIKITGLRPGEKLYEELLISGNPEATSHPKIMRASDDCLTWDEMQDALAKFQTAIWDQDTATCIKILQNVVREYRPKDPNESLSQGNG